MKTIWELNDTEFYIVCRKVEAARVLQSRANRDDMITRLVNDGFTTSGIAKALGYSKQTIRAIRARLGISAPKHFHE
jgi:hypothetical protein